MPVGAVTFRAQMQQDDRHRIEDLIRRNTEKVPVGELAARGNRHVRVISGQKTLSLIEAIVDRVIAQRADELAGAERERIVREAEERIRTSSLLQGQTEDLVGRLQEELTVARQRDKELVGALRRREKRLARMRETILSYDQEFQRLASRTKADAALIERLQANQVQEDPGLRAEVAELKQFLMEREKKAGAHLEGRFQENLDRTLDKISKTLHAATARPLDHAIEATDILIAQVFDDEERMESNLGRLDVRVSSAQTVSGSLERLKRMRAEALGPDEESDGDAASL